MWTIEKLFVAKNDMLYIVFNSEILVILFYNNL